MGCVQSIEVQPLKSPKIMRTGLTSLPLWMKLLSCKCVCCSIYLYGTVGDSFQISNYYEDIKLKGLTHHSNLLPIYRVSVLSVRVQLLESPPIGMNELFV